MLNFLSCLRQPGIVVAPAPLPIEMPDDDERAPGCGWFDSSHELQQGLLVTEHLRADAVAADLPLADWLELHLSGWRAPCIAG